MGVPISEVGYISATARRGEHESSYEHVVALKKTFQERSIFLPPAGNRKSDLPAHNIVTIWTLLFISCITKSSIIFFPYCHDIALYLYHKDIQGTKLIIFIYYENFLPVMVYADIIYDEWKTNKIKRSCVE